MDRQPNPDEANRLDTAEAAPVPPRYRWIAIALVASSVFLVSIVALRIGWGRVANARLDAVVSACRAAQQPLLPDDFYFYGNPVPDERNAALALQRATEALNLTPADNNVLKACSQEHLIPVDAMAGVDSILATNTAALSLLRNARSMPAADWNWRWPASMLNMLMVNRWSPHRALAKLAASGAMYAHQTGNDRESVALLHDLVRQSNAIEEGIPYVITHLIATSTLGLATEKVASIAPRLTIAGDASRGPPTNQPAGRDQVQRLIDTLLDESPTHAGWRNALFGERAIQYDSLRGLWEGTALPGGPPGSGNKPYAVALGPMFKLDVIHAIQRLTRLVELSDAGMYGPTKRYAASLAIPPAQDSLKNITHTFGSILMPSLELGVDIQFRVIAARRMAAAVLAIRLYELDHGHRPPALDDLAPTYLPAVPVDPFSPTGDPLLYRPGADPPVLYSVHTNETDDGGSVELAASGRLSLSRFLDLVFYLDGPPPADEAEPAGSKYAGDDERDVETQGGQNDQADDPEAE